MIGRPWEACCKPQEGRWRMRQLQAAIQAGLVGRPSCGLLEAFLGKWS